MVKETHRKRSAEGCSNGPGPSGMKNGVAAAAVEKVTSSQFYDTESAQSAFRNAPKVTRRIIPRRSESQMREGDDEEESEQPYDENNDRELNARIAGFMQEFMNKKINANNAFETPIFEKLNNVVEVESLQCVGAMLDASARVYAYRVDNTHGECFTVRTNIEENRKKRPAANDRTENAEKTVISEDVENEDGDDDAGEDGMNADGTMAAENGDGTRKQKSKKSRVKELKNAEVPGRMEDLHRRAAALAERFSEISLPNADEVDEDAINVGFEDYMSRMQAINTSRRVGIQFINEKLGSIDRTSEEYSIDDPIYHKVAKEFEEGCAQSFVSNEVLTNRDGNFLILHTNWKNDEPNIPPVKASTSVKYHPLYDHLEGALERALDPNPSNLPLLQEFCQDDDDDIEGTSLNEIRLLGRTSQTQKRLTQAAVMAPPRAQSSECDETASMVSLTDEDRARKATEELAKFQMYLDEDVLNTQPVVDDPFEGEQFFTDDFSEYLKVDEEKADIQKATLHALCERDARYLGIPTALLIEVKRELKDKRLLTEELQKRLFDTIGPANKRKLEFIVQTKNLTIKDAPDTYKNDNQPGQPQMEFLVTRFAPLMDTIWHATIKETTEETLTKYGFKFGAGNLRSAMRFGAGASAMKSASKHRRKPYITPTKTPLRSNPVTPNTRISPNQVQLLGMSRNKRLQVSATKKKPASRLKFPGAQIHGTPAHQNEAIEEDQMEVEMTQVSVLEPQNRVYFWARPREYPLVYLGQVVDEKDSPMLLYDQLDMDEELGFDDMKPKCSMFPTQANNGMPTENAVNGEVAGAPIDLTNEEILETAAVTESNELPPELNTDFNDEDQLSIGALSLQDNLPVETNESLRSNEANNDCILDELADDQPESLLGDLNEIDINDALNESRVSVKKELNVDDDSHWKGGPNALAQQTAAQEAENAKKAKKAKGPTKAKKQRLDDEGNEMSEMNWQPSGTVSAEQLQAIRDRQNASSTTVHPEGKVAIVGHGTINIADMHNPMDLVHQSVLYKRKSGYWKDTATGPEFVELRKGYALRSVEEVHRECVQVFSAKKKKKGINASFMSQRNSQRDPLVSFNDVFGDGDDGNLYDIEIPQRELRSVSPVDNGGVALGDEKDEQLEFNGGIIQIRQTRVKAPMVKRAITTILGLKENDINSLKSVLSSSPVKNRNPNDVAEETHSNDEMDDSMLSDESDDEDEGEDIVARHSDSMKGLNAGNEFKIDGEHTYENLVAYLPQYLTGRTRQDLNVINTFAITLHMCNEHNLRLIQEVDPGTNLISEQGMSTFKIQIAEK